ncbi:MAG: hypothetical protein D6815_09995 [Candidatus Dadabacteria bacterium]|nr:MAG: hypothetical protein D6815_09995 [Candidatus Dadabacteria bacterium]
MLVHPMATKRSDTVLIIGNNDIAADVCLALREQAPDGCRPPVVVGQVSGASRERRLSLLERGAERHLAAALAAETPAVIVQLATSESPVRPRRRSRYDTIVAETVAAAVRLWWRRGGRPRHLVALSSTLVYGLARTSPLVFSERHGDSAPVGVGAATRYGRWVADLCRAEGIYRELCAELGIGLTLLRAAPIVGGPVSSPVTDLLAARFGVRIAGFDPPVQVLHYADLIEGIRLAVAQLPGETLNLASRGVVRLSRLGALAGRLLLPLPQVAAAMLLPEGVHAAALACRCVADDRRAAQVLGFMPTYTAEEAVVG